MADQSTQVAPRRGRSASRGEQEAKTGGDNGAADAGADKVRARQGETAVSAAISAARDTARLPARTDAAKSPEAKTESAAAAKQPLSPGRHQGRCPLCTPVRRENDALREQISVLEEQGVEPAAEEWARKEAELEGRIETLQAACARAERGEEDARRKLEVSTRNMDELLETCAGLEEDLARVSAKHDEAQRRCADLEKKVRLETKALQVGQGAPGHEEDDAELQREARLRRYLRSGSSARTESSRPTGSDKLLDALRQEADDAVALRVAALHLPQDLDAVGPEGQQLWALGAASESVRQNPFGGGRPDDKGGGVAEAVEGLWGPARRCSGFDDPALGPMERAIAAKADARAKAEAAKRGATFLDRASAPNAAHAGFAAPGTSAAILDDGTPAARQARAAEQQLALNVKRDAEEGEARRVREEKLSQENPSYATRKEQVRFLVLRALGNGKFAQSTMGVDGRSPLATDGTGDIFGQLSGQLRNSGYNYHHNFKMLATRRLVRGVATGNIGSMASGVNWPDVKPLTLEDVTNGGGASDVDYSVKKLEPKASEEGLTLSDFLVRSALLHQVLGDVYGSDYTSTLNKFAHYLWQMSNENPRTFPAAQVFHFYRGAWNEFVFEVDYATKEVEKLADSFGVYPSASLAAMFVTTKMKQPPTTFAVPLDGYVEKMLNQHALLGQEAVRAMILGGQTSFETVSANPRKALGGGKASGTEGSSQRGKVAEARRHDGSPLSYLSHTERQAAYRGLQGWYEAATGAEEEVCVRSLSNTVCAGPPTCQRRHDHQATLSPAAIGALPWESRALLVGYGGALGTPPIAASAVRGRIEALRESGAKEETATTGEVRALVVRPSGAVDTPRGGPRTESEKVGGSSGSASPKLIFAASLENPHPAEASLVAAVTMDPQLVEGLYDPTPQAPRAQMTAGNLHPEEELGTAVNKVVRPHLGDAPASIISYVSAFITQNLGDLRPDHQDFHMACLNLKTRALERMGTNGVPTLRRIARELLAGDRAGGRGVPRSSASVIFHPPDVGAKVSVVEIAGVHCLATELGDNCGGVRDQCLVLSFAFEAGVGGATQLRRSLVREAEAARAADEASSGSDMSAEAAFAVSAAHDILRGHGNDVHFPLYLWPREHREQIYIVVKVRTNGEVYVDVMDLRASKKTPARVRYVLVNGGHARPMVVPEQWQGEEGGKRFVRALLNRGAIVEEYAFRGFEAAMRERGGVRVPRTSRSCCEVCGERGARVGLFDTFDVAGRAEPAAVVSPRILQFMHAFANESEDGKGGETLLGADSSNTSELECGPLTRASQMKRRSLSSAQYANLTFEDIKNTEPTADQKVIVDKLMEKTARPMGEVRSIVDEDGPERENFLTNFRETVQLFDSLVEASGGCIVAAQVAFRSAHMRKEPHQTMDPERFKASVEGLVDRDLFNYGLEVQKSGVRVHTTPDAAKIRRRRPQARPPHPDQELEVMVEAFNDFQRGGLVLMSMSPEAVAAGRFADVVASPMFSVPKNNMDGTLSNRRRPVHHQSWPQGESVNDMTQKDRHPPSHPPTHQQIVRLVIYKIVSSPGLHIKLAKRDCTAAFKRCFLQIASTCWFASVVRGVLAGLKVAIVLIWLTLTFGWTGSPGEYGVWPAIIDAAHKVTAPPLPEVNGPEAFSAETFVDDGVLVEANKNGRLKRAAESYKAYMEGCLGEGAENQKKLAEEGAWELVKIVWGILFDLRHVAERGVQGARLSLPEAKCQKAFMFMSQSWLDAGNREVKQRDVQKLGGLALYWAVVVYPLRLALPPIFAMVAGTEEEFVAVQGTLEETERKWSEFEEAKEFVRLIVLQRGRWGVTFTSPMAFALSPHELLQMPGGWGHFWVGGDASGSEGQRGDVVAAIDYDAGTWHAEHMNLYAGALGRVCGVATHEDMAAEEFIIFVKELAALAALVAQHGHRWTNRIACAAWDNQNVVQALKTRRSKNRYVRYLLAIITRCEIEHKFMLLVFYINTHHNHPADDISREFGKWLHLGYDTAVAKMQAHIEQHFPAYAHLRHEPMRALLDHLTDEKHALRSFALPAEAEDPHSLAYQLAQARRSMSPWTRLTDPRKTPRIEAGVAALVELRAGLGQLAAAAEAIGCRVHGLIESDPLARRVLKTRFPAATVVERARDTRQWKPVPEEHLIVLATAASPETAEEVTQALERIMRVNSPSMVMVLLIGASEWSTAGTPLADLRRALKRSDLQPTVHLSLNAAEWGAPTCMRVEILVAAPNGSAAGPVPTPTTVRGPLVGSGKGPQHLRSILRAAAAVPTTSSLTARLTKWSGPRASPFAPTQVARAELGGAGAALFPGALVELTRKTARPATLWRVKEIHSEGLLVGPVGGGGSLTVESRQVYRHRTQTGAVLAIDGVGRPPVAASAGPAGAGNNLILDNRLGPAVVRALLPDECFRLQGHGDEVRAAVEALAPGQGQRQGGLAGRGVPTVIAAETARQIVVAVGKYAMEPEDRCGGGSQRYTTANLRVGDRGEATLREAEAELFRTQLAKGSRAVYDRGFSYWAIWRACRDRGPYLQGGAESFEDEGELIKFVAFFGVVCEYANSTVHGWLHGVQHTHIVNGLGDPLAGKLRLRLVRKGLRRLDRRRRGPTRKLAATVSLLLEVIMNGGLDFDEWDNAVLGAAIIFGFFNLRRSGEFLRKGAEPDADYCVRVGDIAMANNGEEVRFTPAETAGADELIATQRRSKADQEWNGSETNTFVASDARLCTVSWIKHLVALRPEHFDDPNRFLFTLSNGEVLSRDAVSRVLKAAAVRKGLDEEGIDVISLRAGGASAMYHAGFSVEEIQRRGRWASDCWKRYVHEGRTKAKDTAERMAKADFQLLR